jgi:hypothetical protein
MVTRSGAKFGHCCGQECPRAGREQGGPLVVLAVEHSPLPSLGDGLVYDCETPDT